MTAQVARTPAPPSDQFRLGYRPALDGLRAAAILVVVAVHATYLLVPSMAGRFVPGGFVGVDVFFVLSGFLITSLLLEEWDRDHRISLRAFYRRRALRLFPALWFVMVVQLGYALYKHLALRKELKGLAAIGLYVGNWSWRFGAIIPDQLGQTWSLAVEEQFYLFWPLLLLGLLALRNRRLSVGVMVGLAAIAFVARIVLFHVGVPWNEVYVQTEGYLDALMVGSATGVGPPCGMASGAMDRGVGVARGGVHRGGRAEHPPGGRLALRWRLHPRGAGVGPGHPGRPERRSTLARLLAARPAREARTSVLFDLPVARADLPGRSRLPGGALRRRSAGGGPGPHRARQRVLLLRDRTAVPPPQAPVPGASRGHAGARPGVDSRVGRGRIRSATGYGNRRRPLGGWPPGLVWPPGRVDRPRVPILVTGAGYGVRRWRLNLLPPLISPIGSCAGPGPWLATATADGPGPPGPRRQLGPDRAGGATRAPPTTRREEREAFEEPIWRRGPPGRAGPATGTAPRSPDPVRTCFERDRDRILHSAPFRRLAGKTQVFVFPDDHQRTRLTHALEVAQVATAVARACRLNVALTEAIALGHDCGHGPGGHASEDALTPYLPEGFDHAVWGADVVLAPANLCRETSDGIRNHSWSRPAPAHARRGGGQLGRSRRLRLPRLRGRRPRRDRDRGDAAAVGDRAALRADQEPAAGGVHRRA